MRKAISIIVLVLYISSCQRVNIKCEISETAQIGINHFQPLIDAMEKYKDDNGNYPTPKTNNFVPQYIEKIPILNCSGSQSGILPIHNVLEDKRLCSSPNAFKEDGSYFKIQFYVKDDRICLLGGRNNICEYTSETKKWKCY